MANGTLKVSNIETSSGSGTITIGQSGETISVPSGATLDMSSGTMTLNNTMKNTPAFHVYLSSQQDISNDVSTKVQFDTVVFDTDSCYDTSNYRFTPTTAGKYYFYSLVDTRGKSGTNNVQYVSNDIRKNGTQMSNPAISTYNQNYLSDAVPFAAAVIDMNGSTDYVDFRSSAGGSADIAVRSGQAKTYAGGYKLIGV